MVVSSDRVRCRTGVVVDLRGHAQGAVERLPHPARLQVDARELSRQAQRVLQLGPGGAARPCGAHHGVTNNIYRNDYRYVLTFMGAFPPRGAGRFGAGREGAVLLRSVTCRVSTADSTLMVGGV